MTEERFRKKIKLIIESIIKEADPEEENPFTSDTEAEKNPFTSDDKPKKEIKPAQKPVAEPKKIVAPIKTSTTTITPKAAKSKPIDTKPQQPAKPSKLFKTIEPSTIGSEKKVDPDVKKMQNSIYSMKIRLGKLGINYAIKNFLRSLKDYDLHVTKYSDNKDDVMQYLAPLKANSISLSGLLESLGTELTKLEKIINKE